MAEIQFRIAVQGEGSLELPVAVVGGGAASLSVSPLGSARLDFEVSNPLDREVQIPALAASISGPSAGKFEVSLLQNAIVIPAGGTVQNSVTVTASTEDVTELDQAEVVVEGVEG